MGRVVMVTGVSRYLGGRFTQLLQADPDISRVIGVDVVPPKADLGDAEFVRADIRNPVIGKVIAQRRGRHRRAHGGDRHPARRRRPGDGEGDQRHRHHAAAGRLPEGADRAQAGGEVLHRRLRLRAAGPGGVHRGPRPNAMPRGGFAKDSVEVEGYVRGFARRRPDVAVTTLRFANFLGPKVTTPLTSYFSLPVVPTVLGYDPRLQFVHEDDGLEVLLARARSATTAAPSTSRATACCRCRRRSAAPAARRCRCRCPRRLDRAGAAPARGHRLLAGADPVADPRPGRRHHPDAGDARLHARATPPRGLRRLRGPAGAARPAVGRRRAAPSRAGSRRARCRRAVRRDEAVSRCLTPG